MQYHLIQMAAGFSRRFGGNKLLHPFRGKPLYLHTLEKLEQLKKREDVASYVVVTQYDEIVEEAKKRDIDVVINEESIEGIASTVRCGMRKTLKLCPNARDGESAFVFFVSDQPGLKLETLESLLETYKTLKKGIYVLSAPNQPGNPVIFANRYADELLSLTGDVGGKQVIKQHPDEVEKLLLSNPEELIDIDEREDLS